ncbi:MAG TPA: arsenate reductase ArsC [Anaerolineae bacterium]|nr:arsenate reductase ArsC [Anaerolineae bacterium]
MVACVLFLCTGNSARSIMAEALLRHYAPDHFEVYSAGLEPKGINPYTIRVMNEIGLDVSDGRSKDVMEFLGKVHVSYVITVCSNAEERCPIFPFSTQRLHWPFEDPAAFQGTDEEKLAKFREVRDLINQHLRAWLSEQGIQPVALPVHRSH